MDSSMEVARRVISLSLEFFFKENQLAKEDHRIPWTGFPFVEPFHDEEII